MEYTNTPVLRYAVLRHNGTPQWNGVYDLLLEVEEEAARLVEVCEYVEAWMV